MCLLTKCLLAKSNDRWPNQMIVGQIKCLSVYQMSLCQMSICKMSVGEVSFGQLSVDLLTFWILFGQMHLAKGVSAKSLSAKYISTKWLGWPNCVLRNDSVGQTFVDKMTQSANLFRWNDSVGQIVFDEMRRNLWKMPLKVMDQLFGDNFFFRCSTNFSAQVR